MRVTFFLAGEDDLAALVPLDPDRDFQAFLRGERAWILQTFLRLRRAGHPVELRGELPDDGLVFFHVKQRREVIARWRRDCRAVLVAVRADNPRTPIADFEILQNDRHARAGARFAVPHWPQPAILPRAAARGTAIRRVAYHGFNYNMDPRFLAPGGFQDALAAQGIEWVFDSVEFAGKATDQRRVAWNDYRDIDLVLAVRPPSRNLHATKPATKLYNSWHGRTPALLGPEYAYRALRRTPLDYIEVTEPGQALREILALREQPERYQAMVANGIERARDFTPDAILQRWVALAFEILPALANTPRVLRWRGRSLEFKKLAKRLLPFAGL
jgi:hypothetical protein